MQTSFLQHLIGVSQAGVIPQPLQEHFQWRHWPPARGIHSIHFWITPLIRSGFVKVSPTLFPHGFSSWIPFLSARESSYWMESKLHVQSLSRGDRDSGALGWASSVEIVWPGRCLNLGLWLRPLLLSGSPRIVVNMKRGNPCDSS